MAVDGTDEATIEQTLRFEVMAMQDRHKAGKKFFDLIKLYGPGYGLVGTLVGQVGMFGKLASADIGALGHALGIAVVATMYGAPCSPTRSRARWATSSACAAAKRSWRAR